MTYSSRIFLPLAVLGVLGWWGCNTAFPTSYSTSGGSSASMVVNFEGGSPLSVNPNLAEVNRPGNHVVIPGTVGITLPSAGYGSGGSSIYSPGANGTSNCYHVYGTVIDKKDNSYPSIQLQIPLEKSAAYSAYYDAELFKGVKFYLWVSPADSANTKVFSIPVAQTQPASAGGTCNPSAASNACYNNFAINYSSTGGAWQLFSADFSTFTRGNYGAAINPTTLSGANLQQILMLQWGEGNQNLGGTANVDFYVDEVQFY